MRPNRTPGKSKLSITAVVLVAVPNPASGLGIKIDLREKTPHILWGHRSGNRFWSPEASHLCRASNQLRLFRAFDHLGRGLPAVFSDRCYPFARLRAGNVCRWKSGAT